MMWNVKGLVLIAILGVSSFAFADTHEIEANPDYYKISKVEIEEISNFVLEDSLNEMASDNLKSHTQINNPITAIENVGRVIALGKDLVALGESLYQLVIKGKPTNKVTYAPISVIPRVAAGPADIFETEGWTVPVKKTFQIKYENLYGVTVVHFMFSVIYSYNGSLDGKGAYLTAVQVVPEYVKTLYAWDFEATMKLGGIQNMGTKAFPVAGATIIIEYDASSMLNNIKRTNTFFITGKGFFKQL